MTILLLFTQVHLAFNYLPIESISTISNFWFFAAVFVLWILTFMWLLLTDATISSEKLEKLILILIFVLVFPLFWKIALFNGLPAFDGGTFSIGIMTTSSQGHLVGPYVASSDYFAMYPGSFLTGDFFSSILGLNSFEAVHYFEILTFLILVTILFVLFVRITKSTKLSGLAIVLIVLANQLLDRWYMHPVVYGVLLFAVMLFLLSRKNTSSPVLIILVVLAATIDHFITSLLLVAILGTFFLVGRLSRRNFVSLPTLLFSILSVVIWVIYMSWTQVLGTVLIPLLDFNLFGTSYVSNLASANVSQVPFWANATQFASLIIVYILGSVATLYILFNRRERKDQNKLFACSALVGIASLCLLATIVSPGGGQYYRFLLYGSFLTAPMLLLAVKSLGRKWLSMLIILILVLSFSSFLLSGRSIEQDSWYSYELSGASFLSGRAETVYSGSPSVANVLGMSGAWNVSWVTLPEPAVLDSKTVLNKTTDLVSNFIVNSQTGYNVFYMSNRSFFDYERLFGLDSKLLNNILNPVFTSNKIYDNGYVKIYD